MRPLIIAHRGASHLAPENTLTAFRLAKTLGADGFECDVQITRDRHLVVAHDYLTDLKTGVHGNIPDMDFDDLRQLDFGKWKSPEFAGEKIPTLEEVLEVAQDFRMIHIELKPYLDRDEEIVDRIIDAVLDAGLEEKAVLTSFEYGALRRVKERMPQMATCAMTLSPESQLSQPATFWEKLGLKKTDPLVEKLSSPQALSEAAALLEDPSSLDEENSVLIYYLKDRLDFLYSIFPGMNLAEILQQYYYQTDFVNYVAQFGFPVDYVGPEYHAFFRDKDLVPHAHARGFKVGAERRRRARAADQSDGAAADTEQRIAPEERHHAAAKEVLQRDHHNGDGKAQDDSFAALEQRGDTDREADGGEEHDHKNGLQRRVEGDGRDAHGIENAVEDGKAQSADQRSGDAVAAEQRDLVGDDAAQPEQESAQSNSVVHVEFDRQHNDSSFYVSGSARGSHIPLCRVPFQSAV